MLGHLGTRRRCWEMDEPASFEFDKVETCLIVGAGGSAHLCFPSFCSPTDVLGLLDGAMQRLGKRLASVDDYASCVALSRCLAKRYNYDLERVYEHLAHVPPSFYKPSCPTHWVCQCILEEIADRFGATPGRGALGPAIEAWPGLLAAYGGRKAIFTTNYDLVLENVLKRLKLRYARGWAKGQYRRDHFEEGTPAEVALVKLHGSADWVRAKQYGTLEVREEAPFVTKRPACLAPLRRKWHTEEPYASGYDFLERSLRVAGSLVVLGFSWRDVSVATALRSALWGRDSSPLHVHVYDPRPYVLEERVRLFLHESGAGRLAGLLRWQHHRGRFPAPGSSDEGLDPEVLSGQVTLDSADSWVLIPGEPPMVDRPTNGAFRIHWGDEAYYFESGRMVLRPRLPDAFEVRLRLKVERYGSGWDPGLCLEDEAGNEVICARVIKSGCIWQHEGEPCVSGVRVARGLSVCDRVQADEGTVVDIRVVGSPGQGELAVRVDNRRERVFPFEYSAEGRPTRLTLGGYAWYSDDGERHYASECVVGPCMVRPH